MIIELLLFVLFLAFSALFSSSETALFSLPKTVLNRWRHKGTFLQSKVVQFMRQHSVVLITILLGNTFVNVYLTILGEDIKDSFFLENSTWATIIAPLVITVVLLFFGEIIPKSFAFKNAERIAPFYLLPLKILFYLLYPLSYLLNIIMRFLIKEEKESKVSVEELSTFVKIADEEKIFNKNEVKILKNIFQLRQLSVANCLIPRKKIVTVSSDLNYSKVSSIISKYHYSRLPVIDGESEELLGVLVVKRFKILPSSLQDKWVELAIEKPYFIPEQATLDKVARKFSQNRISMAIVVDEYGGIEGILTYQDILERVVGEVPDEYKIVPDTFIEVEDAYWLLKGLVEFRQIEKECGIKFSYEGKARTVNGYLLETLNRLPEKGDIAVLDDYQFKVEETKGPSVIKVVMTKVLA